MCSLHLLVSWKAAQKKNFRRYPKHKTSPGWQSNDLLQSTLGAVAFKDGDPWHGVEGCRANHIDLLPPGW